MAQKITIQAIIEIAGKPQKKVEEALEIVCEKLEGEKEKFKCLNVNVGTPKLDSKTTLFCGFLDIEIEFLDTKLLLNFILDYTPTSVEVISPQKISLETQEFTGILNDFSNFILKAQSEVRDLRAYIHNIQKK